MNNSIDKGLNSGRKSNVMEKQRKKDNIYSL